MRWGRRRGRDKPTHGAQERAEAGESGKPVLAVDVDGVVSLFGYEDEPPDDGEVIYELIHGKLHCISLVGGRRLRRLAELYDLVWASGWGPQTEVLSTLLGLPPIPYLHFGGDAEFGTADWKLEPLAEYAAGRPLAWIDDSLDERCYEWARARSEPTLLVDTASETGLLDVHVEALVGWARSLRSEAAE